MALSEHTSQQKPLEGLTVVDFTIALAGPFATLLLAGLGARVIKVENPIGGDPCRSNAPYVGRDGVTLTRAHTDDVSVSVLNRLRGKLGTTLNLKAPEAPVVLGDLLRHADVVVENFSAGTLDRLGLGYEFGKVANPRLIWCSISGFGAEKSSGGAKAMDAIVQALSGLMLTSGAAHEGPVRVGVPFADLVAPLFGVIGILSALNQRQRTGTGQFVDVSMLGALTALVANEPFELLERCGVPARTGSTVPRLAPFGVYPTRDGSIAICAPTEVFARGVFAAIGLPDLTGNGKFATRDARVENVGELNTLIERYTSTKPTDELVATFDRHGVPVAPVRAPADAVRDVRVQKRGETVELAHRRYGSVDGLIGTGVPIVFSDAITGFAEPAPALGEHNDFVYGQLLGYTQERIRDLKNSGAI